MDIAAYIKELNNISMLSETEEKQLWEQCCAGDESARQRIIEAYQPLVFKTALPYRSMDQVMDIIQEGTVGLIEAVDKYDPSKGVAFSLYAVHRICNVCVPFPPPLLYRQAELLPPWQDRLKL